MAITRHLAQFILHEHAFRPITGRTLLLGRQVVFMTPDRAQAVIAAAGLPVRTGVTIEYDKNEYGRSRQFISDASFFELFCDSDVVACDVSDAEHADLIFDLSASLPAGMEGRFNFIYNGSVLDNVFDPAACIRNVSRMLTPTGVVLNYEGAAHSSLAYFRFTPEWFFDYYALNRFADYQAYVCTFDNVYDSPWRTWQWEPFYKDAHGRMEFTYPLPTKSDAMVVAVSENSPTAGWDKTPIQGSYRTDQVEYLTAFEHYRGSGRRAVGRFRADDAGAQPVTAFGYRYLGLIG